jgi:hypothetical protein
MDEYKVRVEDKDKDDVSIPNRPHLSSLSCLLFQDQDIGKVIWSMHYVLAQDIARRFTFGLTIDDRVLQLARNSISMR